MFPKRFIEKVPGEMVPEFGASTVVSSTFVSSEVLSSKVAHRAPHVARFDKAMIETNREFVAATPWGIADRCKNIGKNITLAQRGVLIRATDCLPPSAD